MGWHSLIQMQAPSCHAWGIALQMELGAPVVWKSAFPLEYISAEEHELQDVAEPDLRTLVMEIQNLVALAAVAVAAAVDSLGMEAVGDNC